MRRLLLTPIALLALMGCDDAMYQQAYAVQEPPTLTQIQGQCFSSFKVFAAQANCITDAVSAIGIPPDARIQEYLLLTEALKEKVGRKTLTESDARLKLASKLTEIKALQQNEFTAQEQLAIQRDAQNAEVLRQYQYKAPLLEMPQIRRLPSPTYTNCQAAGNQVNCTSR